MAFPILPVALGVLLLFAAGRKRDTRQEAQILRRMFDQLLTFPVWSDDARSVLAAVRNTIPDDLALDSKESQQKRFALLANEISDQDKANAAGYFFTRMIEEKLPVKVAAAHALALILGMGGNPTKEIKKLQEMMGLTGKDATGQVTAASFRKIAQIIGVQLGPLARAHYGI